MSTSRRPLRPLSDGDKKRFRSFVIETDGCWGWSGNKNRAGYPMFALGNDKYLGHRVSWLAATGIDPGELLVLHRCDNPECTKPEHLFLGTHRDNSIDAATKGRWTPWNRSLTHCRHGHEFTPENTYRCRSRGNRRACLTCLTERNRVASAERRARLNR